MTTASKTASRRVPFEPMPADVEHVEAVLRATALLDAFRPDDERLTISELARRAVVPKTTALRLARTLASVGYLVQMDDSAWRLGPATARLAARYQTAFALHSVIEPALHRLSRVTRESTSFFAYEGHQRVRLLRVHGDHPLALATPVGEALPLDRGSPGKVILAAIGQRGALYDEIRRLGFHVSLGEAQRGVASVAAPVFGRKRAVLGSICVSMSVERARAKGNALLRHAPEVVRAARKLSALLDAETADGTRAHALLASSWHP